VPLEAYIEGARGALKWPSWGFFSILRRLDDELRGDMATAAMVVSIKLQDTVAFEDNTKSRNSTTDRVK